MPRWDPFPKSRGGMKNRQNSFWIETGQIYAYFVLGSHYLCIFIWLLLCVRGKGSLHPLWNWMKLNPCFPYYCSCLCSSHCKFLTAACSQHWRSPWCLHCITFEIRHLQKSSLSLGLWLSAKSRNIPVVYIPNFMEFVFPFSSKLYISL